MTAPDLEALLAVAEGARDFKAKGGVPGSDAAIDVVAAYLELATPDAIVTIATRLKAAEEALRPFEAMAAAMKSEITDDTPMIARHVNTERGPRLNTHHYARLTAGDFRRAAAYFTQQGGGG